MCGFEIGQRESGFYGERTDTQSNTATQYGISIQIYQPHSGTAETLIAELVEIFNKIPNFIQQNIILIGDFNINLMESLMNPTQVLFNFKQANYFSPIISRVSAYYPNPSVNPSLLDHVWVNFMGNTFN